LPAKKGGLEVAIPRWLFLAVQLNGNSFETENASLQAVMIDDEEALFFATRFSKQHSRYFSAEGRRPRNVLLAGLGIKDDGNVDLLVAKDWKLTDERNGGTRARVSLSRGKTLITCPGPEYSVSSSFERSSKWPSSPSFTQKARWKEESVSAPIKFVIDMNTSHSSTADFDKRVKNKKQRAKASAFTSRNGSSATPGPGSYDENAALSKDKITKFKKAQLLTVIRAKSSIGPRAILNKNDLFADRKQIGPGVGEYTLSASLGNAPKASFSQQPVCKTRTQGNYNLAGPGSYVLPSVDKLSPKLRNKKCVFPPPSPIVKPEADVVIYLEKTCLEPPFLGTTFKTHLHDDRAHVFATYTLTLNPSPSQHAQFLIIHTCDDLKTDTSLYNIYIVMHIRIYKHMIMLNQTA